MSAPNLPKLNVIAQLEFELAFNNFAVEHFSQKIRGTAPGKVQDMALISEPTTPHLDVVCDLVIASSTPFFRLIKRKFENAIIM